MPVVSRSVTLLYTFDFTILTSGKATTNTTDANKVVEFAIQRGIKRIFQYFKVTHRLKIVAVLREEQSISDQFLNDLDVLDRAYPEIDIEFIKLTGTFSPAFIKQWSNEWKIPVNFMFIAAPSDKFPYKIAELGGVRLII